jgi:protein transport protein SEC61 subunit alpha
MGEPVRFIYLIKPLLFLIPKIPKPQKEPTQKEKFIWTSIILFIFLICSQIPLYGIYKSEGSDPIYWMRAILASSRGTLMELGISPLITSSMIMQVLAGTKIIEVDQSLKSDKELYEGATKIFGILISFGEAIAYVFSGQYGDINNIGVLKCMLLIFQLVFAGIMVMVLDELLSKGYGLGSGISLFLATNISENILWKSFSPFTVTSDRGIEYEGAIITAIHLLMTKKNKVEAIHRAFYRNNAPNLSNLVATIIIFLVVIYFQGFRKEIRIASKNVPGLYVTQPIKLFYCSNTPIILESALVSNLYFISQILYKRYKHIFIIRLLGQWEEREGGQSIPIGGLAYYISPPRDLRDFIIEPLHSIIYVIFILLSCGLFSKTWVELSGKSARDIAKNLRDNNYFLTGVRETEENVYQQLNRYIPAAATLGGMCIGLLTIFADFMGAIGSGTGILLAVSIIYEYFEELKKRETEQRMMRRR